MILFPLWLKYNINRIDNISSLKVLHIKKKDGKQTLVTSRIGVGVEYTFSRLIENELELHRK